MKKRKYPAALRSAWVELSTFFKSGHRRLIYTTNLNRSLRKVTKAKAAYPSDILNEQFKTSPENQRLRDFWPTGSHFSERIFPGDYS
jgi:hypothetical protein